MKSLTYKLNKERIAWAYMAMIAVSLTGLVLCFIVYVLEGEIKTLLTEDFREYIYLAYPIPFSCIGLLYSYFSSIKRKVFLHYGIPHKGEIVKARYGSPGRWGTPNYYLEIDFTNSKGKRKTLYTPGYYGDPNSYLKSAKCFVYEWKGFYVEGNFQMRDKREYLGYGSIPTEKKHFIWR